MNPISDSQLQAISDRFRDAAVAMAAALASVFDASAQAAAAAAALVDSPEVAQMLQQHAAQSEAGGERT